MDKVYVIWDPLLERVVCVHSSEEEECKLCEKAREDMKNTYYYLHGKWFSIDSKIELCYCGNPVDMSNTDCIEYSLCQEHKFKDEE